MAAPEQSPRVAADAPRPPSDPSTIDLVFGGPVTRASIPSLCARLRVLLERSGAEVVVCDVAAVVDPDAVTVDALARLKVVAGRLGRRVGVRHACEELEELFTFMGLSDVVLLMNRLPLEAGRQAEERKQRLSVEEEADSGDRPV